MKWLSGLIPLRLRRDERTSSSVVTFLEEASAKQNQAPGQTEAKLAVKVDVAVCVYGKPVQTAVTLASLFEHSGQHIDKVYFQEEEQQPHGASVEAVASLFQERNLILFKPEMHLGLDFTEGERFLDESYRLSIRYQYAWENSDKKFLFIIHNDCLFSSDIIGGMLARLESESLTGVGMIGQCWNCPAKSAEVCSGDTYESYQPTYEDAVEILDKFPAPRTFAWNIDRERPMPLPECRLNEFACLINLDLARPATVPHGDVWPLGSFTTDTGTAWFRGLVLKGHRFLNWSEGLHHAYFSVAGNGFALDGNEGLYDASERQALEYCLARYPELGKALASVRPGIINCEVAPTWSEEAAVLPLPSSIAPYAGVEGVEAVGQFFRIVTYHGSVLAVRHHGQVVSVVQGGNRDDLMPLFAYVVSSASTSCFLMADLKSGTLVRLAPQRPLGSLVPLRMTQSSNGGSRSLYSPETGRFLVAVPPNEQTGEGYLALEAEEAREWEQMRFERVTDGRSLSALQRTAAFVDSLGLAETNPRVLSRGIIRSFEHGAFWDVLNAVGLLLLPEQISVLADSLIGNHDALDALSKMFEVDVYAKYAIPCVLAKLPRNVNKRDPDPPEHIKALVGEITYSEQAIQFDDLHHHGNLIDTDLDLLADEDVLSAKYLSLPGAVNRQLRLSVQASRRACIVATARNEGLYLLEWVAHHRAIGFERIFLYSNDNSDGSDELLDALNECGAITLVRNVVREGTPAQPKAYGHALRISADPLDYAWTLIIDLDEFFVPHGLFDSVQSFLDWHETRPVDAIPINWQIAASSGESFWRDKPLSERFPFARFGVDPHVKTIFRTKQFVHSYPHDPTAPFGEFRIFRNTKGELYEHEASGVRARSAYPTDKNALIAHFFFKSKEEMIWKCARNRGDDPRSAALTLSGLTEAVIRGQMHASGDQRLPIGAYAARTNDEIARFLAEPRVASAWEHVKARFKQDMPALIKAARSHPAMLAAAEDGVAFMRAFEPAEAGEF